MKYKNLFFDFDGVIAESLSVKTDAFYKIYLPYGKEIANKVVAHHKNNGGMSRFEKFKLYHKTYLDKDLSEDDIQLIANDFSKMVLQGVIESKLVTGVKDFIKDHHKNCEMWIVSGTPTFEIRKIAEEKKLAEYFYGVYGSPESKTYWLDKIISENDLLKNESIFFGDATVDYEAAKNVAIDFALRQTTENNNLFKDVNDIIRFNDFIQLKEILYNT